MPESILLTLTQFGAAGLIGALWLFERRHAAHRERQLDEAHRRLTADEREISALLEVIKENTRAINALELSQRRMVRLIRSLNGRASDPPLRSDSSRAAC
ncbi:MAG TPA: hypothetical protein PK400_05340 [Phycisphaerales bacterium]|nr:hypothetical protein [Phycisphaerales bacterium]HRQ75305.1 hypothetical protein [Phycisphaerales bacterium]